MHKHSLSCKNAIFRCRIFLSIFLFFTGNSFAQQYTVSGTVTNSQTGEPVQYASITVKNTLMWGTISDSLGNYKLKVPGKTDTICFSEIGFYSLEKTIVALVNSELSVELVPKRVDLSVIDVKIDERPIRNLMNNIFRNKEKNNPDQYSKYSYRKYTKWECQINNVTEKIINSALFRKNKTVFKTEDDSSKYLPLYFSEQLVFNEVQKNPPKQKSTVIADKTTGVGILKELEISGYTSALDMEVNFYDNYINLFTKDFVSPIADNGWFYYKYYLADSIYVNGHLQYRVNFRPRRKGENTFKGYFTVEDQHYSLAEIDGDLSSTSGLNFLKSMHLKSNYTFVNDSTPFYKRNQIDAVFDYIPFKNKKKQVNHLSLFYTQTANIDQVTINQQDEIKLNTKKAKYETVKLPDVNKDSLFWKQNRIENLSSRDVEANAVIDSISKIRVIKFLNNIANMSLTSYYDIGKIELGPYPNIINTNEVEGLHLFMGARTSEEINKNFNVWGGIGYGSLNKKVNYMFGFGYKFPTTSRQLFKLNYDDNIVRFGENEKILYLYENAFSPTENDIISQFLKHGVLDEIYRQQKASASFEKEWYPGLSNKLSASYTTDYSPPFYPFYRNGLPVSSVSAFEVLLDTRFSKEEKLIDKGFLRIYMGTEYPILHVVVGGGKTFYAGQSDWYGRIMATMYQGIHVGQTRLDYALEAGMFFGKLPYTMLDIPRGNETVGYYSYDFNMLDYLEYVHDNYFHAYLQYHLNGFFFRRIPLLKSAHTREVLSARFMLGSVSDKHQKVIFFPSVVTKMANPYIELGAGVENILTVLHVEAFWRVTPQSVIGAPPVGLKAQLKLEL